MPETKEQFIRNTEESINLWRSKAVMLRREGKHEDASRVDKIAADWTTILEKAKGADDAEA